MGALSILYQDEHLIAVHKPAGMLVHRTRLASRVRESLLQTLRDQIGRHLYPVHRLDRPTSGLIVFGLTSAVARTVSEQFASRTVHKQYLAIVRGHLDTSGSIETALIEKLDKLADSRAQPGREPQQACTRWARIRQCTLDVAVGRYPTARYSLLSIQPETGRKHQIRRHLRRIAHPIIGDRQYGDREHNRFFAERLNVCEMLLAAVSLRMDHPVSGLPLELKCPLSVAFQCACQSLGWSISETPACF